MKPQISHTLQVGDTVRLPKQKTKATVVKLVPDEHWPNCVLLNRELSGWKHWDANELEKVDVSKRR